MMVCRSSIYIIPVFISLVATYPVEKVHKVHNINLYPNRYAWCEARAIKMVVGHLGCESHVIDNKVCVGQCFSYSVPATIPRNIFDERLTYCDNCRPSNFTWVKIEMFCQDPDEPRKEKILEKRLQVVHDCACTTCPYVPPKPMPGSDVDRLKTTLDVPELIDEQQLRRGVTSNAPTPAKGVKGVKTSKGGSQGVVGREEELVDVNSRSQSHKKKGHRHKKHRMEN